MLYLRLLVRRFLSIREQGQGLVEYALIISLVAILIIAALLSLHGPIEDTFSSMVSGLQAS